MDELLEEKVLECKFCGKVFINRSGLERHVMGHAIVKPFKCTCGTEFCHKSSYKRHQLKNSCKYAVASGFAGSIFDQMEKKNHPCGICGAWFTHKHTLKRHLIRNTCKAKSSEEDFDTKSTVQTVSTKSQAKKRRKVKAVNATIISTKKSKVQNQDANSLKVCGSLSSDAVEICIVCRKDFASKTELEIHMKEHIQKKPSKSLQKQGTTCKDACEVCIVCRKDFASMTELEIHMKEHIPLKPKTSQNDEETALNLEKNSNLPERLGQNDIPPDSSSKDKISTKYTCKGCGKGNASSTELSDHLQVCKGGDSYQCCFICNKLFQEKYLLRRHLRRHKENGIVGTPPKSKTDKSIKDEPHKSCPSDRSTGQDKGSESVSIASEEDFDEITVYITEDEEEDINSHSVYLTEDPLVDDACDILDYDLNKDYKGTSQRIEEHNAEQTVDIDQTVDIQAHLSNNIFVANTLSSDTINKDQSVNKDIAEVDDNGKHLKMESDIDDCLVSYQNEVAQTDHKEITTVYIEEDDEEEELDTSEDIMMIDIGEKSNVIPDPLMKDAFNECSENLTSEKELSSQKEVNEHLSGKGDEQKYTCNICKMNFTQKSTLRKHMAEHGDHKKFKCSVCWRDFLFESDLVKHMESHRNLESPHSKGLYKCNICKLEFRKKCGLITHIRTHYEDRPFECDLCNLSFGTMTTFKHHQREHKMGRIKSTNEIKVEDDITTGTTVAEVHFESIGMAETDVKADQGDSDISSDHLEEIRLAHTDQDTSSALFPMDSLGHGSVKLTEAQREQDIAVLSSNHQKHDRLMITEVHSEQENSSSRLYDILNQERVLVSNSSDLAIQESTLSISDSAIVTTNINESSTKSFRCYMCGKTFVKSCALGMHLRSHRGHRPYPCSICKEALPTKKLLKVHLRAHKHQKIVNYKKLIKDMKSLEQQSPLLDCLPITDNIQASDYHLWQNQESSQTLSAALTNSQINIIVNKETLEQRTPFIEQSTFKDEVIVKHKTPVTNQTLLDVQHKNTTPKIKGNEVKSSKKYKCKVCWRSFGKKSGFVMHVRTHSADRQFSCVICTMTFRTDISLRLHLYKHRREGYGDTLEAMGVYLNKGIAKKYANITNAHQGNSSCSVDDSRAKSTYTEDRQSNPVDAAEGSASSGFSCPHCNKTCKVKNALVNHIKTHTEFEHYPCTICNLTFYLEETLRLHQKKWHSKPNSEMTLNSKKHIKNEDGMGIQMEDVDNENKDIDPELSGCDNTDDTESIIVPRGESSLWNSKCVTEIKEEEPAIEQSSGKSSNVVATRKKEKAIVCKTCKKVFKYARIYYRHRRAGKCGMSVYKCSECGKRFNRRYHLKRHMKVHGGGFEILGEELYNERSLGNEEIACHSSADSEKLTNVRKEENDMNDVKRRDEFNSAARNKNTFCFSDSPSNKKTDIKIEIKAEEELVIDSSEGTFGNQIQIDCADVVKDQMGVNRCTSCDLKFYRKNSFDLHMELHAKLDKSKLPVVVDIDAGTGLVGKHSKNKDSTASVEENKKAGHLNENPNQTLENVYEYNEVEENIQEEELDLTAQLGQRALRNKQLQQMHYKCNVCLKDIPRAVDFILHLSYHKDNAELEEIHYDSSFILYDMVLLLIRTPCCLRCEKVFCICKPSSNSSPTFERFGLFTCEICWAEFEVKWAYVDHMSMHGEKVSIALLLEDMKKFLKTYPERKILQENELFKKRFETDAHNFVCKVCGKVLERYGNFIIHLQIHMSKGELMEQHYGPLDYVNTIFLQARKNRTCVKCGKFFRTYRALKMHKRNYNHEVESEYKCMTCLIQFKKKWTYENHIALHKAGKYEGAGKAYTEYYTAKTALLLASSSGENDWKVSFANNLQDKTVIHSENKPPTIVDGKIDASEKGRQSDINYSMNVVIEEKPGCIRSENTLGDGDDIQNSHEKMVDKDGNYNCPICNKLFNRYKKLLSHQKVHLEPLIYDCDKCQRSFPAKEEYEEHRKIHFTGTSHECPICGMKIAHSGNYNRHYRSHFTSDEDFNASQSSASKDIAGCIEKSESVERVIATGKRPRPNEGNDSIDKSDQFSEKLEETIAPESLHCWLCSETFSTLNEFKKHEVLHPLTCSLCGHKFDRRSKFLAHIGRHSLNDIKCKFCWKRFLRKRQYRIHLECHKDELSDHDIDSQPPNKTRKLDSSSEETNAGSLSRSIDIDKEKTTRIPKLEMTEDSVDVDLKWENPKLPYIEVEQLPEHSNHIIKEHRKSMARTGISIGGSLPVIKSVDEKVQNNTHKHSTASKLTTCPVCDKKLASYRKFKKHRVIHLKASHHTCGICRAEFKSMHKYLKHIWIHKDKSEYCCYVCGKQSSDEVIHMNHCGRHTDSSQMYELPWSSEQSYEDSVPSDDTAMSKQKCVIDSFLDNVEKEEPSQTHTFSTCKVCGQKFKFLHYLEIHMKVHSENKLLTCDICHNDLPSEKVLYRHKRNHSLNKGFHCLVCGKSFFHKSSMIKHSKFFHQKKTPIQEFASAMKYSTVTSELKVCDKSDTNLKKINEIINTDDQSSSADKSDQNASVNKSDQTSSVDQRSEAVTEPNLCGQNDVKITSQSVLTGGSNIYSATVKKTLVCPLCGKTCSCRSNLNDHVISHSKDKPWKCPICHVLFKRHWDRNRHIKNKHLSTTEAVLAKYPGFDESVRASGTQYLCSLCDKRFLYDSVLKMHMMFHTGKSSLDYVACEEDSYECTVERNEDDSLSMFEPEIEITPRPAIENKRYEVEVEKEYAIEEIAIDIKEEIIDDVDEMEDITDDFDEYFGTFEESLEEPSHPPLSSTDEETFMVNESASVGKVSIHSNEDIDDIRSADPNNIEVNKFVAVSSRSDESVDIDNDGFIETGDNVKDGAIKQPAIYVKENLSDAKLFNKDVGERERVQGKLQDTSEKACVEGNSHMPSVNIKEMIGGSSSASEKHTEASRDISSNCEMGVTAVEGTLSGIHEAACVVDISERDLPLDDLDNKSLTYGNDIDVCEEDIDTNDLDLREESKEFPSCSKEEKLDSNAEESAEISDGKILINVDRERTVDTSCRNRKIHKMRKKKRLRDSNISLPKKNVYCSLCDITFETSKQLFGHIHIHAGLVFYQCDVCGETLKSGKFYKEHALTHITEYFDCANMAEVDVGNMDDVDKRKCRFCNKSFPTKHQLIGHMHIHSGQFSRSCEACGDTFESNREAVSHLHCHLTLLFKGTSDTPTKETPESFISEEMASKTSIEKPFPSDKFAGQDILENEVRETIEDQQVNLSLNTSMKSNALQDTSCSSDDMKDSDLIEKPFSCMYCPKVFLRKNSMRTHMRLHTGERLVECSVCFKKFVKNSHLVEHLKIHSKASDR